jgi:outer membrane protein, heavy metal efflux system
MSNIENNMKSTTMVIFCFVVWVLPTAWLDAQVLSLESVLKKIETSNPMLQEYDYKIKALDEYAAGARSWMAPMVGAGTFMKPYRQDEQMHERDKGAIMFSVEQEIPNPGKLNANSKYLKSRSGLEKHGRDIQFNTLRAEAKTYYYQWLIAERKSKILHENKQVIEMMEKLATIRYPYNQGSLGNIYKLQGRISEVENMILMSQADIEDKERRLKALMSLPAGDSIMIDTATVVDFEYSSFILDTAKLVDQRSDIHQIDETIQVMQLNQRLQRAQAKPDFRIRFDHMEPIGDMPAQFTAMAMISIPIAPWASRMYKAEIRGMQSSIEAMRKSREATLLESKGMMAGMAAQLRRMKQQLANYETKIIPALSKNYQTLMLAYEENREQLPVVIDGWEALNMAQMEYLERQEEFYLMIVNYEKELEK